MPHSPSPWSFPMPSNVDASKTDFDNHPNAPNPPPLPPPRPCAAIPARAAILAAFSLGVILSAIYLLSRVYPHQALPGFNRQNVRPIDTHLQRFFDMTQLPHVLKASQDICSFCDCQANRTSPPLLPSAAKELRDSASSASLPAHVWLSIRDTYCHHPWLSEGPALDLLLATDLSQDISSHIQWRLNSLDSGVPTAFLFTKTSWAGKTKHLRYAFFRRHILTIRTHIDQVRRSNWPKDSRQARWGEKRQLIWIVIEDGDKLANDVAQELATADISYIYFTYGPTHHFGNAQQNAAYSLIHRLTEPSLGGPLGHGPIISIDDDSNFLPELLEIIWNVKRIGIWPMGNLGPHGWEGPIYDDKHNLVKWEAGAVKDRKFPVDNGAFAFSSELLGKAIKGPRYWPTDISGGENEFISLIVQTKEEIESLCYNCHLAWHNEPLPPACVDLQRCP